MPNQKNKLQYAPCGKSETADMEQAIIRVRSRAMGLKRANSTFNLHHPHNKLTSRLH